jgi:hypothetical protein
VQKTAAALSVISSLFESSLHWALGKMYVYQNYLCNFQDTSEIFLGDPIALEIIEALKNSKGVVAFVTLSYPRQFWTCFEVGPYVTLFSLKLCP